jgi:hypothetical protein
MRQRRQHRQGQSARPLAAASCRTYSSSCSYAIRRTSCCRCGRTDSQSRARAGSKSRKAGRCLCGAAAARCTSSSRCGRTNGIRGACTRCRSDRRNNANPDRCRRSRAGSTANGGCGRRTCPGRSSHASRTASRFGRSCTNSACGACTRRGASRRCSDNIGCCRCARAGRRTSRRSR